MIPLPQTLCFMLLIPAFHGGLRQPDTSWHQERVINVKSLQGTLFPHPSGRPSFPESDLAGPWGHKVRQPRGAQRCLSPNMLGLEENKKQACLWQKSKLFMDFIEKERPYL